MTQLFTALALLALPALPAHAIRAKPLDFTHCNPQAIGGMMPAPHFRIGANGALEFDKKGPLLKSHKKDGQGLTESLVLKMDSPYGTPTDTMTVTLRRSDGRLPEALEQALRYSPRSVQYPGGAEWKSPGGEYTLVTRFGYERGGKCFVSQVSSRANGKEIISYDAQACSELLGLMKKVGTAKIRECFDINQQLTQVLRKHESKAIGEGKLLRMGWGAMMPGQAEPPMTDTGLNPLLAAGTCQWTLSLYGHQVPPEESLFGASGPGMAPVSGATSTDPKTDTAQ